MSTAVAARPSLMGSRFMDFWLVGGLSILAWALLTIFAPYQAANWSISRHISNIPAFASLMSLMVNYPHFLISYKLSYAQGVPFIKRHWWQMIVVPILLIWALTAAWFFYRQPDLEFAPMQQTWGRGKEFGESILGGMVKLMFLTVGWHYTKQMFGIMMVYSRYDGYGLSNVQRHITKLSLFSVWIFNYGMFSGTGANHAFNGINYVDIRFPDWVRTVVPLVFYVAVASFGFFVLWKKWQLERKAPPVMFLLPWISIVVWWIPGLIQNDFYMYLVPLFHSLQYLCFVRKSEQEAWAEKAADKQNVDQKFWFATIYIALLVASSWLAFEALPAFFDRNGSALQIAGINFFLIAFTLFLNIHHYFIDNVLWRFKTSIVAQRLVRS